MIVVFMTGFAKLDEVIKVSLVFARNIRPLCVALPPAARAPARLLLVLAYPEMKTDVSDIIASPRWILFSDLCGVDRG